MSRTPVLASKIGGIPELIKDGEMSFLFEAGNESDLREKLQRIADDPECLNKLRVDHEGIMSIEEHAKQTTLLYENLILRRRR